MMIVARTAPVSSADESSQCETESFADDQKHSRVGLIDAAKRMQVKRMKKILSQLDTVEQSSCPSTTPRTVMPPLGLGLGSGLGSNMPKSNALTAAAATAFMESRARGVNARDEKGRTALHFASGMASPECARLLLEAGADANVRAKDGLTPIHMAAGYGRCQCVRLLLEHGNRPQSEVASFPNSWRKLVPVLSGASVVLREKAGRTPLELALEIRDGASQGQETLTVPRGDMDLTVELLVDAESKDTQAAREKIQKLPGNWSTSRPYQKLLAAAATGNLTELPPFLQTDPSTSSALTKKTLRAIALGNALSAACRGGHVEVAELLLTSGAQVDAHDADGATPLLAAADSGFAKCVQLLLKHGAHADAKDRVGVTALIAAAYNGHTDCVEALLEHGALVDARSHGGVTPLIAAAEGRNSVCVQVLVQAGAQLDAKTSEGKTALMHAVSRNCIEATEALLVGGANVNAADGDGCTALHHGARNNAGECLKILLDRDADVTRKCKRGRTPRQEAPKGSLAAKHLDDRWKQLESEIAQRQVELLDLFAQDRSELTSNTPRKPRHAREKKRGKRRKEVAEKTETERGGDLKKVTSKIELEGGSLAVDVLSSSGSEGEGNTADLDIDPPTLEIQVGSEDFVVSHNRSLHLCDEEVTETNRSPGQSPGLMRQVSDSCTADSAIVMSSSSGGLGSNLDSEDVTQNGDNWITVDVKGAHHRLTSTPATPKNFTRQQGGAKVGQLTLKSLKPGEVCSADHLPSHPQPLTSLHSPTGRKASIAQAQKNNQNEGVSMNCKEDEPKEGEVSPWVHALLRRNHSEGDGVLPQPYAKADFKTTSTEQKGESIWEPVNVETSAEASNNTQDQLTDRLRQIGQELEQASQAAQVAVEKEGFARGVRNVETNLDQVVVSTQALEVQVAARVQAEIARKEMESCLRDRELVIASQRKALEACQAEVAGLKQQLIHKEEQHKQECEIQHRESVAAAMAAAAASWRAWELQHTRDNLRGWLSESPDTTTPCKLAPLLHQTSQKVRRGPLTPLPLLHEEGQEQPEKESTEWNSAATAAAMAAASMIGSKNSGCFSNLGMHSPPILTGVSQNPTIIETVSKSSITTESCNWDPHEVGPSLSLDLDLSETSHRQELEDDALKNTTGCQESTRSAEKSSGPVMTRSASESSLNLMEGVSEQLQQQQQLLPFVPMAGPRTDPANGWFSLVPSPVED